MKRETIRARALQVLVEWRELEECRLGRRPEVQEFYPLDVEKLVRQVLGWELEFTDGVGILPNGRELRGKCDFENKRISISTRLGDGERRFTVAHEFAHVRLRHAVRMCRGPSAWRVRSDRAKSDDIYGTSEVTTEQDADRFAAELVMPVKAVKEHFKRVFGKPQLWVGSSIIDSLANRKTRASRPTTAEEAADLLVTFRPESNAVSMVSFFGVSREAMTVRLLELGLVYN